MRGYLIDPVEETVNEVEGDFKDNKAIYAELKCDLIDIVTWSDQRDVVVVDDEGHLHEGNRCWEFDFQPGRYFAGRGLILGMTESGDTTEPSSHANLDWLRQHVSFPRVESTGDFGPTTEGTINHPTFGKMFQIIGGDPQVRPITE